VSYVFTQNVIVSWVCRIFRIEYFHRYIMVRRKLTWAQRWQSVGMSQARFSNIMVAGYIGVHHYVIDRPLHGRVYRSTPLCNWSSFAAFASNKNGWWTSAIWHTQHSYILRDCCARWTCFPTTARLRDKLNLGGHVYVRTINRRLNEHRLSARRPIKRLQLSSAGSMELVKLSYLLK
jgi:hypothetical protein